MTAVVSRPRMGGKTHRLIEWAAKNGGTIVASSAAEKRHIISQARMRHPEISWLTRVVDPGELRRLRGVRNIAIDNADWLLAQYLGLPEPPAVISVTGEES